MPSNNPPSSQPTRRLLIAMFAMLPVGIASAQDASILRGVEGDHPAGYYRRAADLFGAGKRDEAVFVFYLGQLRYRTHLAARPELPRDRDAAAFASLSEVVGRPINEYAFGDLPALDRTLKAVMAYDAAHPDAFTPPERYPQATRSIRTGMEAYRQKLLADADQIRAARLRNGLTNRH
ncbi:MAG: hypothetical protein FD152_3398 [Xanthobacteraceae bacterium]|nr:MAG: hypothetical protein FD152_3398 [Xanthobacteraceae bacterium]